MRLNEVIQGVFVKGKGRVPVADLWGTLTGEGWSCEEQYVKHFSEN